MTKTYITTAIPYMNGNPHIGHAVDYCLADVYARYRRACGDEVRLQAGADEHGNKIYQKAMELGLPIEEYVDKNSKVFKDFIGKLGVEYTDYVRTTDKSHEERVQKIWQKLEEHIYKADYEGWYCTGCERYITQKEYDENGGICPDHQKPYEKLQGENYYLRIADFKDRIRQAIETDEMLILPDFRKKEVLRLLEESPDVSISRPTSQLTWGVPVPGDDSQVMYVWIDALSNYLTVIGYPDDDSYEEWWPATAQFVGKDILRFHAIIWPAMLIGLGLPLPKTLVSHGMVLANGQKMSKSIGNVVEPLEVLGKYGQDAFRYFFLRHVDTFADSDFTWEKYDAAYNNELANDLGNLVQRLATLANKNQIVVDGDTRGFSEEYKKLMDAFEFSKAFDCVWDKIQALNKRIDEEKPWSLAKNGEREKLESCLGGLIRDLLQANYELTPFLPEASGKIFEVFSGEIEPPKMPLFPKDR
ncbi:MAG: methionine--tRNA ligase [Candidatus Saccharibacteria bacterium]|nr:methionine--tRNA ligase [Candidatus Saccharibacteria bacterium]